jgi:hypothetical protein
MSNSKKRSDSEVISELAALVDELGWVIGLPDDDEQVQGLIIGTREYVEDVVEVYYGPGFAVFEKDEQGEIKETPPSKKTTLH